MIQVFLWVLFALLWIGYPIYFLFCRNKINSKVYKGLIALFPVLGLMQFIGKITLLPSDEVSLLLFVFGSVLFGIHAYRVKFKKGLASSALELVILAIYALLATAMVIEML